MSANRFRYRLWDKLNNVMMSHADIDFSDKEGIIMWGEIFNGFGFSMQDPAQPEAYNYVALELIERVGNVWENPGLLK